MHFQESDAVELKDHLQKDSHDNQQHLIPF